MPNTNMNLKCFQNILGFGTSSLCLNVQLNCNGPHKFDPKNTLELRKNYLKTKEDQGHNC